jgi:His-Xaa-Ser system protein HxsD
MHPMRLTRHTHRTLQWSVIGVAIEAEIVIDTSIHDLEAVKRLCYSLSNECITRLERVDDTHLRATCRAIGDAQLAADFAGRFDNGLIDFGIRVSLARETASIRDLIFRQAFVEADL